MSTQEQELAALAVVIDEVYGLCICGHSAGMEHNSYGCYARLSYSPLVTCGCKRDHGGGTEPRMIAEAILAAGYERRRDHVAEQDELRKQVRG